MDGKPFSKDKRLVPHTTTDTLLTEYHLNIAELKIYIQKQVKS